jgi:hypothetical protein
MEVDDMTEHERDTVSSRVLRQAGQAILGKRRRLIWAVHFAQEPLDQLSPGRLYDLRLELTAFLTWGGGRPGVGFDEYLLVTEDDLRATQAEFAHIIAGVLQVQTIPIGEFPVKMQLGANKGRVSLSETLNLNMVPVALQARYGLARALGDVDRDLMEAGYGGPIIKACPAPKVRGKGEEKCGRWFIGRPNQVYCSGQCQNRAATRATRARASAETSETKRGRRKQRP